MANLLGKSRRCEDPDVQAIIDAGTESVEWVRQEFARADLRDKRLDRRLLTTAEQLAKSPSSPINEACGNWASTQAAYRLFNNPKASTAGILKPHWEATASRMAGCGGPVLVMQDTVFFSYGTHPKTRGLGPIGKSNSAHDRGLIMHNALAFTTSGVPLGILSQSIWARGEIPEEDYQEKIERLQVTAIGEKESSKWLVALRETVERAPAGVPVITVADRQSDFFEFLTQAKELRAKYLIRACTNRKLVPEDSEGCASMLEALSIAPALGSITVAVPSNGSRKARTASIEVRVTEVTIQPPPRSTRQGVGLERASDCHPRRRDRAIAAGRQRGDQLGVVDELGCQRLRVSRREGALVREALGHRDLAQGAQIGLQGRGLHARGGRAPEALSDPL